jgi:hypothetical protein
VKLLRAWRSTQEGADDRLRAPLSQTIHHWNRNFSAGFAFLVADTMPITFRHRCLVVLLCACSATGSLAQDPNKAIAQYVKAAGGSGKLSKIRTVSLEGALTRVSDGQTGTFTLDTKFPNRYYLELLIGDHPEILSYNGKSAWRMSANGEAATLLEQDALQLEASAFLANSHLLDLHKNKVGIAYVGTAKLASTEAQQIELTMPTGVKRQLFFDASSHLLKKDSGTIGNAPLEFAYDDYRAEEGVQIPHKLRLHRAGEIYDIIIHRVVVNGVIGERVFDFPRKSQIQLPDLKQLFTEIDGNQKAIDKLKENYTGSRAVEETQYDSSGKVTKLERREETFFYLDGEDISTLVAKDGKPLSDDDQRKENERVQKRIAKYQEEKAHKEKKEEKAREEGKDDKDSDDPGIEIFLRACQFVNPRRERFRGQDVLVFDFEGNPEYKPKKLAERVVQQLAGVVWVDEKAHDVARLEAYFVKDVHFGGGLLANLQKGTSFVFEQAFVNNEVWLPTYEEAHIGARVLLVKGFKVNEVTRYSDYHRFNIETLSNIGKPKPADNQPPDKP